MPSTAPHPVSAVWDDGAGELTVTFSGVLETATLDHNAWDARTLNLSWIPVAATALGTDVLLVQGPAAFQPGSPFVHYTGTPADLRAANGRVLPGFTLPVL